MRLKQVLAAVLTLLCATAFSQKQVPVGSLPRKCATMDVLKNMLRENPALADQWKEEGARLLQEYSKNAASRQTFESGTIVVPIVMHIVTDNPNDISDRDVLDQVEQLNIDYAGKNVDTAFLTPEFKALFAGTHIRFVMARRAQDGSFTTGIERKATTLSFNQNIYANIKHASSGGLDAWDVTTYFNIWVGNFSDGLLGISTFPFMTPANEQGVVLNNIGFGLNPCHVDPSYNLGRTLVHETGHYFYLFHTWGDDQDESNTCSGVDFDEEDGYPLPSSCTDDTPNQSVSSSGFLAGYVTDACSPAKPGINYQNYMDYTNDVSYGMFTTGQVCRMHNALELYRSYLKTTLGGTPVASLTDAYLVSMQPGGSACGVTPSVYANTPLVTQLRNSGNTMLSSISFNVRYDGAAAGTIAWTGKLLPGHDTLVNLGPITAAQGAHTITVYTTGANGGSDGYAANDTLTKQVTVVPTAIAAPFTESFEGSTYPPAGWTISNPDKSVFTWVKNSSVGYTGTHSAYVLNYQDSLVGQWDDLITPPIDFGDADSATLSFRLSYQALTQHFYDGLDIWVSTDGGATWLPAYRKAAPDLSTVTGTTTHSFVPSGTAQWRLETVNLQPFLVKGQKMLILFRNIAGYGNNLYIDDINVTKHSQTPNDAAVKFITVPAFTCTGSTVNASAKLMNNGINALTSVTINYTLDKGTVASINWTGNLAAGDTTTVALPAISTSIGQHNLLVYSSHPNNSTDPVTANDTARQTFAITGTATAPLLESFESNTFPPAGWGIGNPDLSTTWQQVQKANAITSAQDIYAAYINNFNYSGSGNIDELRSPQIQYGTVDSVFLTFDVAAAHTTLPAQYAVDTLQVYLTSDCGNTLQLVYQKYGADLQTTTAPAGGAAFVPANSAAYRKDSVNLTGLVPLTNGSFQVVFRSVSNNRNNIYIDSVHVYTKVLPALLKEQGYLIYPNPFTSSFAVQHYHNPTNLRVIQMFDAIGRRVYAAQYDGNASSYITVYPGNLAHGVYFVNLVYTDHKVTVRVVK